MCLFSVLLSCADGPAGDAEPLIVSAASSMTFAFREIAPLFERRTGAPVVLSFGATGHLALQIEQGAPVDVFAAAGPRFVDSLEVRHLIHNQTRRVFCLGDLVAWSRDDGVRQLASLEDLVTPLVRRIAIANPHHAPYGELARRTLVDAGLWDQVQPRLVLSQSVRQALEYAEAGDVDVAFVPLPLATIAGGRWLAVPDSLYPQPIQQIVAAVRRADSVNATAVQFVDFLMSPEAQVIFRRHGFRSVELGEMAL